MPMESDASDVESNEELVKTKHFRFADVLAEVPNGDAAAATELILKDRALTGFDSLEALPELKKLELCGNKISALDFLEMNHALCWLNLARNCLRKLSSLNNLSSLAVLDLSDNKLTHLSGLHGLQALKALILARNRISRFEGVSAKKNPALETLVLSHNRIPDFSLSGFQNLRKLSLGHNKLHEFPMLKNLPALSELRLNENKITRVTDVVTKLSKLSILDIGKNLIKDVAALETLRGLLWLKSLNLLGNPVAEEAEQERLLKDLLNSLQRLEIVNNRRQVGETQKKKRKKTVVSREPIEAVAVHGRTFDGQATVFADSDDDADGKSKERRPKLGRGASRGRGSGRGRGISLEEDDDEWQPLRGRGRGTGSTAAKVKKVKLKRKKTKP